MPIFYTFGQNLQTCSQNDVVCLITNLIKIILQSNKSLDINQLTAQIAGLATTMPTTTSMSAITPIKILYPMENSILTVGRPIIIKWLDLDRKLKTFNIYLCTTIEMKECNFIALSDSRSTSTLFTPTKLHESKSAFIRFKIFYPDQSKSVTVDSPKFVISSLPLPPKPTTSDQQIDNFYIKAVINPVTTEFLDMQSNKLTGIEANNFVSIQWKIVDAKGNVIDLNNNPPNIPDTIDIGVCINNKYPDMTSNVHCQSTNLSNDTVPTKVPTKMGKHFVYIPNGYETNYIQFYISYRPNPKTDYRKSVMVEPILWVKRNSIFYDDNEYKAIRMTGAPQLCIVDNRLKDLFCKVLMDTDFYDPYTIHEYLEGMLNFFDFTPNETTKITVKIPGEIIKLKKESNYFTSPMPFPNRQK